MFTPMRKLKASGITAGILTVLSVFGITVDNEFQVILKEGVALLIPIVAFIPQVIAYFTKNNASDLSNMVTKEGK